MTDCHVCTGSRVASKCAFALQLLSSRHISSFQIR